MSRDFHSLDRLRLDKYLYLLRCYFGAGFEMFLSKHDKSDYGEGKGKDRNKDKNKSRTVKGREEQTNGSSSPKKRKRDDDDDSDSTWPDELDTYIGMLEEGPLCPYNFDPNDDGHDDGSESHSRETKMPKGPDGIRYHLMDLWLDEIEKCATELEPKGSAGENEAEEEKDDDDAEGGESSSRTTLKEGIPMELLLRPIVKMRAESPNKIARKRAAEVLEDERLVGWGVRERKEEGGEDDSDDGWAGFD